MTKMKSFWSNLPQPFFALAPMEAVTDVVFRHVVQRAGAPDVFFTEFANATGWVHAGDKAIAGRLLKTDDEHPLVAQIWGGEPGDMEQFAAHCARLGFDGIDINMGCPAKSAIKSGGAALIRRPDVAVAAIHAAKTAGLPVSVKTRLGYTHVNEWREWLRILLKQDIANLTIHLRTKKEMSKVPAHYELINDIVALRDAVAPHTLLTINGDIRDRKHGLALVSEHPGVNGIMIGRGVFANPFCFAAKDTRYLHSQNNPEQNETISKNNDSEAVQYTELFGLLYYHLDLFDRYQPQTGRPFETLKRFFKIYVKGFDGAKELRDQLMHTASTDEVRQILRTHSTTL
jgi:dihydrouridine synthase duS